MSDYNKEQLEAHDIVIRHLAAMTATRRDRLRSQIEPYFSFRKRLDDFIERHFSDVCTRSCFTNRRSACCSREGIITFFADSVVNALYADLADIRRIMARLRRPNNGVKCVYLTDDGCMWTVRPIVCAMFLCDPAREKIFGADPSLTEQWEFLNEEKKRFTWPDRPVLFNDLEAHFIQAGFKSPLMYLHFSPGLLRIKRLNRTAHAAPKTC